jgi:hypothetical protein
VWLPAAGCAAEVFVSRFVWLQRQAHQRACPGYLAATVRQPPDRRQKSVIRFVYFS